ncbi:heavy-metal-associated domain-containing protein [Natronolimnobius sp. AArcel1]|nr:heavy-metal-associated domain-containing protein [Natronolimnobius sp. AArcel1]
MESQTGVLAQHGTKISVTGESCAGCKQTVEEALHALEGVTRVSADHEAAAVERSIDGDVPDEKQQSTLEDSEGEIEG